MSRTIGHWANLRSHGCFVYFEHGLAETPEACRALVEQLLEGLGLEDLEISTKDHQLQWSKFAWKKVDAALQKDLRSLTFLVGEPSEVHLGARITLATDPQPGRATTLPPCIWLAAESARWPEERFAAVARSWLRIAAERCRPLSGGVLAAANLRNAKVEVSLEYESFEGEAPDETYAHLRQEPFGVHAWEKLRRVYPITLLGPKLAARVTADQLRAAGASTVEALGDSLVFEATPQLEEAWSPGYLAATQQLRELVWPWSFQHALDDPKRRPRR